MGSAKGCRKFRAALNEVYIPIAGDFYGRTVRFPIIPSRSSYRFILKQPQDDRVAGLNLQIDLRLAIHLSNGSHARLPRQRIHECGGLSCMPQCHPAIERIAMAVGDEIIPTAVKGAANVK